MMWISEQTRYTKTRMVYENDPDTLKIFCLSRELAREMTKYLEGVRIIFIYHSFLGITGLFRDTHHKKIDKTSYNLTHESPQTSNTLHTNVYQNTPCSPKLFFEFLVIPIFKMTSDSNVSFWNAKD